MWCGGRLLRLLNGAGSHLHSGRPLKIFQSAQRLAAFEPCRALLSAHSSLLSCRLHHCWYVPVSVACCAGLALYGGRTNTDAALSAPLCRLPLAACRLDQPTSPSHTPSIVQQHVDAQKYAQVDNSRCGASPCSGRRSPSGRLVSRSLRSQEGSASQVILRQSETGAPSTERRVGRENEGDRMKQLLTRLPSRCSLSAAERRE